MSNQDTNIFRVTEGYFHVPNEIFEESLTPTARVVYIYMCWCSANGQAIPSYKDIAYMCDIGKGAAHRAVRELIAAHRMIRVARFDDNGRQITNLYLISGFPAFATFLEDECKRLMERVYQFKAIINRQKGNK